MTWVTWWPRFQGGRRSHGSLPSSPPCACGPGRASSLPHQPNFRGERSPNWWDLVRPGQAAEAQLVDTGLARQHRGGGSRDWELVDGSESAAATPIPAALLAGTRGKVTGHPLSPDDPPNPTRPRSTATHRASRRVCLRRGSWRLWRHLFVSAPLAGRWAGPGGWPCNSIQELLPAVQWY